MESFEVKDCGLYKNSTKFDLRELCLLKALSKMILKQDGAFNENFSD